VAEAERLLTERQREVAALIACGYGNVEIARGLVIAPGTAANHVRSIMQRLSLRSRTEVAVWALQHGLQREPRDRYSPTSSAA
jgi:two-component system nitrate/nitrite response regulator NarL